MLARSDTSVIQDTLGMVQLFIVLYNMSNIIKSIKGKLVHVSYQEIMSYNQENKHKQFFMPTQFYQIDYNYFDLYQILGFMHRVKNLTEIFYQTGSIERKDLNTLCLPCFLSSLTNEVWRLAVLHSYNYFPASSLRSSFSRLKYPQPFSVNR